jgi:hypothetical protein
MEITYVSLKASKANALDPNSKPEQNDSHPNPIQTPFFAQELFEISTEHFLSQQCTNLRILLKRPHSEPIQKTTAEDDATTVLYVGKWRIKKRYSWTHLGRTAILSKS